MTYIPSGGGGTPYTELNDGDNLGDVMASSGAGAYRISGDSAVVIDAIIAQSAKQLIVGVDKETSIITITGDGSGSFKIDLFVGSVFENVTFNIDVSAGACDSNILFHLVNSCYFLNCNIVFTALPNAMTYFCGDSTSNEYSPVELKSLSFTFFNTTVDKSGLFKKTTGIESIGLSIDDIKVPLTANINYTTEYFIRVSRTVGAYINNIRTVSPGATTKYYLSRTINTSFGVIRFYDSSSDYGRDLAECTISNIKNIDLTVQGIKNNISNIDVKYFYAINGDTSGYGENFANNIYVEEDLGLQYGVLNLSNFYVKERFVFSTGGKLNGSNGFVEHNSSTTSITNSCFINNVEFESPPAVGSGSTLKASNCIFSGISSDTLSISDGSYHTLVNCRIKTKFASSEQYTKLANCDITYSVTLSGQDMEISNCRFLSTLTDTNGGNMYSLCYIGSTCTFTGTSDIKISDSYIHGACDFSSANSIKISNCELNSTSDFSGADNITVIGSDFTGTILLSGDDNTFSNNHCAITIEISGNRNGVKGNHVYGGVGANSIDISAGTYNDVTGNICAGAVADTGGGAGNVITPNIEY